VLRVRSRRYLLLALGALIAGAVIVAPNALGSGPATEHSNECGNGRTDAIERGCLNYGPPVSLGAGELRAFGAAKDGHPTIVGLSFSDTAMTNLPTTMSDGERCYDVNGDGTIGDMECAGGHQREVELPKVLADLRTSPFEWVMVNWNVMGHGPPMVYDEPHFDVHFYMRPRAEVEAIRVGPCGNVVNCDDYATGRVPVPAEYNPTDYGDYGFVQGGMGNHLVDKTNDEWTGGTFDRTFVYGSYNGEITYLEPMITKEWLDGLKSGAVEEGCFPIKQPRKWQVAGWYPEVYCGKYDERAKQYQVSLERFRPSVR
jgi:hypothetical protein